MYFDHGSLPCSRATILVTGCSKDEPSGTAASRASPAEERAVPHFDGLTITALTQTGPHVAEVLQRRAPEFMVLTGARVEVHGQRHGRGPRAVVWPRA